jgi:DNA-binding NarL/FixJ family response regulator
MPRYLVVEDEELVQQAMRRLLGPYGEVVLASTVREASRLLASHRRWGAFFIDVGLPDGSGIDVLARARADHPATPAMVLTGCTDPDAINAAFDLDAEFVVKPVRQQRLAHFLFARPDFAERLERALCSWRERHGLSEAEADVLRRTALGEHRQAIAEARCCSPLTIKAQVANLLRKCGDDTLSAAVSRLLRAVAGDAAATP